MCSHTDVSYTRVIKMMDVKVYIKMGREVDISGEVGSEVERGGE